jgi:hypothetical protein
MPVLISQPAPVLPSRRRTSSSGVVGTYRTVGCAARLTRSVRLERRATPQMCRVARSCEAGCIDQRFNAPAASRLCTETVGRAVDDSGDCAKNPLALKALDHIGE